MTSKDGTPKKEPVKRGELDKTGLAALTVLVVGLVLVVWFALPKDGDGANKGADAGALSAPGAEGGPASADGATRTTSALERLPEATCELAVLTDKLEADVAKLASAEAIGKLLDVRHCGASCDAIKKVLTEHEHFEIEMVKSEDYILPPKESFATIAPGLTAAERASISQRLSTVVVRSRGPATIDQLPARAAFAVTAVLAEALSGLVYDEVVRRIETSAQFLRHTITVPLGQNVWSPKHVAIQLYRQEDGTARLLTLGMVRFGSPDFTMHGAPMELGSQLANVMNAAASYAAAGRTDLPIAVTLADVARIVARSPAEVARDPASARPIALQTVEADRTEGDPENELLELVPPGGATREAWTAAMKGLFGETPPVVFAGPDKELDAIASHARRDLPLALKRFEAGDGSLYIKAPFPIPAESRVDGGATEEWMWLAVSACDAQTCSGLLSNTPGYATNLVSGSEVKVERTKAADWLLTLKDGGTTGGESEKALRKRAR